MRTRSECGCFVPTSISAATYRTTASGGAFCRPHELRAVGESVQILRFTRTVKDRFSYQERVDLIEMLWEVVYADGVSDAFENQLMRRIGGLIYVSDRDRGEARLRVLARREQGGSRSVA